VVKDEVQFLSLGAVVSLRLDPVRNKLRSKIGSFRMECDQGSRMSGASTTVVT